MGRRLEKSCIGLSCLAWRIESSKGGLLLLSPPLPGQPFPLFPPPHAQTASSPPSYHLSHAPVLLGIYLLSASSQDPCRWGDRSLPAHATCSLGGANMPYGTFATPTTTAQDQAVRVHVSFLHGMQICHSKWSHRFYCVCSCPWACLSITLDPIH